MTRMRAMAVALGLVLCGALGGAAPAGAATGSISGTVTSAETGEGIADIYVCAYSPNFTEAPPGCDGTDVEGKYRIDGLLSGGVYSIAFEEEGRHNYVAQWYPGKPVREQAELVQVNGDVTGKDAVLEVGGQIVGHVTDKANGEPIEDIQVCAPRVEQVTEYGVIHCDRTDADGEYRIQALPTGNFTVEFSSPLPFPNPPNYILQYYPGKPRWEEAEVLHVDAGSERTGIDAAMQEGIQVSGKLTEAGSGAPVKWVLACALNSVTEAPVRCTASETDGTYSIAGLPFGTYVIGFAIDVEEDGQVLHPDGYVRQYYDHKAAFGEATVLGGPGPATFTGIDATLTQGPEVFPNRRLPVIAPTGIVSVLPRPVQPRPHTCRKGFHRKKVGRQLRCVKNQKKKHRKGGKGKGKRHAHRSAA